MCENSTEDASSASLQVEPDDVPMPDVEAARSEQKGDQFLIRSAPPVSEAPPDAETSGLKLLGSEMKKLLSAIRGREKVGVSGAGILLPKIIVVGDKSSGKSSLIEAMLDITLPRDPGRRCITQIDLRDKPNSSWHCKVLLVTKYDLSPEANPTTSSLHPWVERDRQIDTLFGIVKDKALLVDKIRLAQIAALNPQEDPKKYTGASDEVHNAPTQVHFSPNIVSLEIAAPGLPELSFYELPGIISQSQDGRSDTVTLIERLASDYIAQKNTMILLTVPMELPISNSVASALLNKQGAAHRTIGVLTKPDRLPPSQELGSWESVLRGEFFKMGHGYFVVKQPSQTELDRGVTHGQAKADEDSFFATDWVEIFGSSFQEQLGTGSLLAALPAKLTLVIRSNCEDIIGMINSIQA